MKFQYKILGPYNRRPLEVALELLGGEGWELVSMWQTPSGLFYAAVKRTMLDRPTQIVEG